MENKEKIVIDTEERRVKLEGPDQLIMEARLQQIIQLGGLPVSSGQALILELTDEPEFTFKFEDGLLAKMEALLLLLRVTATDRAGNTAIVQASPQFD